MIKKTLSKVNIFRTWLILCYNRVSSFTFTSVDRYHSYLIIMDSSWVHQIKEEFPGLQKSKNWILCDAAGGTQVHQSVISAILLIRLLGLLSNPQG